MKTVGAAPDEADPDTEALDALMRASRAITAIVARSMVRTDNRVTIPQLRVLVLIGSRSEVTTTAVAEELQIHLSSASRLCDRVVSAGWASRRESPQDRRRSLLSLSRRGRRLLTSIMADRRRAFEQVLAQMPMDARRDLAASLEQFAEAAAEPASLFIEP